MNYARTVLLLFGWLAGPAARAQPTPEQRAVNILCRVILPNVNRENFFSKSYGHNDSIYYDGSVINDSREYHDRPYCYKDRHQRVRRHFLCRQPESDASLAKRARIKQRKVALYARYRPDDKYSSYPSWTGEPLADVRLHLPGRLSPIGAAFYSRMGKTFVKGRFLRVYKAVDNDKYVLVEMLLCVDEHASSTSNVPLLVVLTRKTNRLVDWYYVIPKERD